MNPSKQQLALDFVRRGSRDLAAARSVLEHYLDLAIRYGCDEASVRQALGDTSSAAGRHRA